MLGTDKNSVYIEIGCFVFFFLGLDGFKLEKASKTATLKPTTNKNKQKSDFLSEILPI